MAVRDREMKLLMRYVTGELDKSTLRRVEERLGEDAELRAALQGFQSTWSALTPPGADSKVPDQTSAILSQLRREQGQTQVEPSWLAAPMWIKTGSVASLVVGMAMGLLLTSEPEASAVFMKSEARAHAQALEQIGDEEDLFLAAEPTSADLYWQALEASSGGLGDERENGS